MTWRRLIEHPQQWVLACCAALLLLLIGAEVWHSVDAFFYRPATPPSTAVDSAANQGFAEPIISAQLFGVAAPQSSNNQNLPATSLQLTLRGVFTSQDPHSASAMIETGDGHAQIVKAGANLAADTVLQQVFSNHVVLARNGALESLYFPVPQEGAGDIAVAQNSSTDADSSSSAEIGGGATANASPEELKRAAILRRLEELRARSAH